MTLHYHAGALRAFVSDLRRHAARPDGTLDRASYHRWRAARAGAEHRFPIVWRLLDTHEKAQHALHTTRAPRGYDLGGGILGGGILGGGITDADPWLSLTMAGLGMNAGQSPSALANLGTGALGAMRLNSMIARANNPGSQLSDPMSPSQAMTLEGLSMIK